MDNPPSRQYSLEAIEHVNVDPHEKDQEVMSDHQDDLTNDIKEHDTEQKDHHSNQKETLQESKNQGSSVNDEVNEITKSELTDFHEDGKPDKHNDKLTSIGSKDQPKSHGNDLKNSNRTKKMSFDDDFVTLDKENSISKMLEKTIDKIFNFLQLPNKNAINHQIM